MIWFMRLIFLAQIAALPVMVHHQQATGDCSSCEIVQRALKDAESLKVGTTRQDIAKSGFVLAGGWNVRDPTVYVYSRCDYIKLEVNFTLDPKVEREFSPKDTISKISGLEIVYPARD